MPVTTDLAALIAAVQAKREAAEQHRRDVPDHRDSRPGRADIEHGNALNHGWADAQDAVAAHPVGTITDLRAKLAFMIDNEMGDGRDWLEEINADVLRIAAAGGLWNEARTRLTREQTHEAELCHRIDAAEAEEA